MTLGNGSSSFLLRILYWAAIVSAAACALAVVASVAGAPANDQNACQLAQVVAMTRQNSLYPDPSNGVLSSWTDGPLAAVLLAPSALGKQPTSQIILGLCINLLVVLGPTLWLLCRLAGPGRWAVVWPCFALTLWWLVRQPSLSSIAFVIGADGLAVGFVIASIAFLTGPRDRLRIAFSAACMALACWTKLSVLPVSCVLIAYLAIVEGRGKAGFFAMAFLGVSCVTGLMLIPIFGAKGMWFQMITLPGAQPWMDASGSQINGIGKIGAWVSALRRLIQESRIPLAVLAGFLMLGHFVHAQTKRSALQSWLALNTWIMIPASAILLAPGASIDFLKMGRSTASFALPGYLLAITAAAVAIRIYCRTSAVGDRNSSHLVLASICILLIWESIGVLFTAGGVPALFDVIRNAASNKQETVLKFAREHPQQTYFPWNTLSTLLADGRLYHNAEALRLRSWTGSTVSPTVAQITDHLPRNIRWIAIDPSHSNETLLRIFPRATARVELPGLEGFTVYTEPGVGAPR